MTEHPPAAHDPRDRVPSLRSVAPPGEGDRPAGAPGGASPIEAGPVEAGPVEPVGGLVEVPTDALAPRGRSSRRWLALVLVAALTAGFVVLARFRIPYYALSPGSIRPAEPLIDLGSGTPDPDAGDIAFATVSVEGRVSLLQALAGWWDPAVDIVDEDLILGGRSPEENSQVNQVLMRDSKQVAVQVALHELGLSDPAGAEVVGPLDPAEPHRELEAGDVIVGVAGHPVDSSAALIGQLAGTRPGDSLDVDVRRDDETTKVQVQLTNGDGGPGVLPYQVRDAFHATYDGDVTIDSGPVGGPSAGLAFTLGIIDLLSAGDLTGGKRVAATGTIAIDGTVGPIGGIQQKAVAARRAGIELFLVPNGLYPSDLAEARELSDGVELVPVGSLDDALAALAAHGGDEVALPARDS